MNKDAGMHIVIGCTHVPFHNKVYLDGVIQLVKKIGGRLKGFHIIGDFLDMNSLSAHDRGKLPLPGITLGAEYKEGNNVLNLIDKAIKPANLRKTYTFGNHEDRYYRHIKEIDDSKYGDALLSPVDALHLDDRGYEYNTDWKNGFVKLGDHLELFHGEFLGVNPSRTQLNKLRKSCMFAHTHRFGMHYEGNMAGFNIGWGGNVTSPAFDYAGRLVKMNWINGLGIVTIDDEGFFHATPISFYNNRFYYNGKRYPDDNE